MFAFSMTPIRWLWLRPSPRSKRKRFLVFLVRKVSHQLPPSPNSLWSAARRKKKAKKRRRNNLFCNANSPITVGEFLFSALSEASRSRSADSSELLLRGVRCFSHRPDVRCQERSQ